MDRRRSGAKTRPPNAEELGYWAQTLTAVNEFNRLQAQAPSTDKVNKWMTALPQDEILQVDGLESLKMVRGKLTAGLNEIKANAEAEAKALNDALEHLRVLIALRRGPDGDKRNKRIRLSSPSSLPGSPRTSSYPSLQTQQSNGGTAHHPVPLSANSISSSGRSSQGPPNSQRDPRTKREWLMNQLPLQPGRKVAFRQPPQSKSANRGGDFGGADAEGETWILAVVKRCIGGDPKKYEVQDDDTEDGEPGQEYKTSVKSLIPLPVPEAAPNSPSHPNAYEEFLAGTEVLGLYPDTSCFYKAVVVSGPRDPPPGGSRASGAAKSGVYRLKFEDDDDQVRAVGVQWVVGAPP